MSKRFHETHLPCPHRRRRRGMRILLSPNLLLMLAEGEAHGYHLYDRLLEMGFDPARLDSSVVYRDLRDMEDKGLIESHWDEDSMGPRRRVYRMLPGGLVCLSDWIEDLSEIRARVSSLVKRYHGQVGDDLEPDQGS